MTAVWEVNTRLFKDGGRFPFCHYSLEHAGRTSIQEVSKEETWLTYANNYSWTDRQQNPDAEKNSSDANRLLPCGKHNCTHTLSALVFYSLYQLSKEKHGFPPTKGSQNILLVKGKVHANVCFRLVCTQFKCLFLQFKSTMWACNSGEAGTLQPGLIVVLDIRTSLQL